MRNTEFIKGNFYHIYNRGVEKRLIFGDDNDRWRFLQGLFLFNDENTTSNLLWRLEKNRGAVNFKVLKDFFKKERRTRKPLVRIIADCLMPNHYHLLVEEIQKNGISRFMHKLGTGYTKYFNNKYARVGSLCQGPFKAIQIDKDTYLEYLLIYINVINPGELIEPNLKKEGARDIEKILDFAEKYFWSTHLEFLNKRNSIIIEKGLLGKLFPSQKEYYNLTKSILLSKNFDGDDAKYLVFE